MGIKKHPEQQKLLILSKDIIEYKKIIEEAGLPYLSILSVDNPRDAIMLGNECNLLFGEPSLVSQVINNLPNLQWCQITWAGVEPLLASGLRRDYTLTNARNVYGSMMSEYVFGYLLFIERRILTRWQSQLNRNWDESPNGTLKDKAIGLLGVGTIGSHLATTAHHFGMRVHGYSRNSENCQDVDQYFHGDAILDFVSNLDYLVSSLPATPATMQMINNDVFSALPNKAWLVNIGRGSTVDETALVNALNSRMISGAILDVFEKEPLPEDHPLWQTPNTFVTSHTAARNYIPDIARLFIENYKLYINGKSLHYQVSFEKSY